jgi:hypothetical protein
VGRTEPVIRHRDVAELCAEVYQSRHEALAVGLRLRTAGWVVIEHAPHPPPRPDGVAMVASIYHPVSYESPGDLLVTLAAPDLAAPDLAAAADP